MARQKVIDEIANDRVRLVAELCDYATNQRAAAAVPFQVDCTMQITRAVDLGPAVGTAGLFSPDFDEVKLLL